MTAKDSTKKPGHAAACPFSAPTAIFCSKRPPMTPSPTLRTDGLGSATRLIAKTLEMPIPDCPDTAVTANTRTAKSSNPHKPLPEGRGFVLRRLSYAYRRPKLFTDVKSLPILTPFSRPIVTPCRALLRAHAMGTGSAGEWRVLRTAIPLFDRRNHSSVPTYIPQDVSSSRRSMMAEGHRACAAHKRH